MGSSKPHPDLSTSSLPAARVERAAGEGERVEARARGGGRFASLSRHRWAYLFISPFFILFGVFAVYPIVFSLWLSLHSWRGVGQMKFIGLDNYMLLFRD